MSERLPFLKITFVRSDGFTQLLTVGPGESVLVGRDLACECRLEGRKVSRRHMRLTYRPDGEVVVQDNGSHNGIYINGVQAMEMSLRGGDAVTVGEREGRVEFVEGTQPARRRTLPGVMPAVEMSHAPISATEPGDSTDTSRPPGATGVPAPRATGLDVGLGATGFDGPTDPALKKAGPAKVTSPFDDPPQPKADQVTCETRVVDMRHVWRWDDESVAPSDVSSETMRAMPVVQNPIVQRLTKSQSKLDFRGISDIDTGPRAKTELGASMNVDAVALELVFQVTEALQKAPTMDGFLAEMSDSLCSAARAKAVVVLLPDEGTGELVPRVVKNRREGESVEMSRTVLEHAIQNRAALATEDAAADARFASGESVLRFDLKAVLVVPLTRGDEVVGALYLTRDLPFTNTERDLVAALAHLIAVGLERARLKEAVQREEQTRRTLERFHAPDVVRRLMMDQDKGELSQGLFLEQLTATILFCDLAGFTKFCENADPTTVGALLNEYLGTMTEIVFRFGGTVDKYIGDAIMCIFGAPFASDDDALRAVQCAVAMRAKLKDLAAISGSVAPDMKVHIGINTGPVVAGTVGSSLRMEYTALGDTVNIAARLESVAKAGQIVMGPTTAALVRDQIRVVSMGNVALKGRDEAIEVFEVPEDHEAMTTRSAAMDSAEVDPPTIGAAFELASTAEEH